MRAPFPPQSRVEPLRSLARVLLIGAVSGGLFIGACSSSPPLLSRMFGPAVEPKPLAHKPRREPYEKPRPQPVVEMKEEAPRTDWVALVAGLPKDAGGATDWVRALEQKLIEPKVGLEPKAEEQPVLDLAVELEPKDMPDFKATFPHKAHTQLLACTNCHTGIFQMEKGADPISMEKIMAGEYCGRCHGKVAFEVPTGCPRCHLGMPK